MLLGADRDEFSYRVTAPDMATAHATSILVAVGIVSGQSPVDVLAALNQIGFHVSVRFDPDRFSIVSPGPPGLTARLVDLIRASIDVASDGPAGGCIGLSPRLDQGFDTLGLTGTCVQAVCTGEICPK